MILAFSNYLSNLNVPVILNFLISMGLSFCGFFFAFAIKKRGIKNRWFTSLRYILTTVAIASFSNVYSLLILGYKVVQPSELLLNGSLFVLMLWASAYYAVNIHGSGTSLTQEKVLKFIEKEHSTTSS
jgi:hypothetical protein